MNYKNRSTKKNAAVDYRNCVVVIEVLIDGKPDTLWVNPENAFQRVKYLMEASPDCVYSICQRDIEDNEELKFVMEI